MKTFTSKSLEETSNIAREWLSDISKKYKDSNKAVVVGLSGHLGAGKTAFVKEVAKILEIKVEVTSPTFVIMKRYMLAQGRPAQSMRRSTLRQWKYLIHIDAYRLEKREELGVLEWDKLIRDKNNIIMIEWPENVGLKKFGDLTHISFESDEGVYKITIE